jgi:hypothetical protein
MAIVYTQTVMPPKGERLGAAGESGLKESVRCRSRPTEGALREDAVREHIGALQRVSDADEAELVGA